MKQTLDGTLESPSRIIIMTSNRPEVLDSALIRPGRMDLKLSFGPASRDLTLEIVRAFFERDVLKGLESFVPDKLLTPAEVFNVLFTHVYNEVVDPKAIVRDLQGATATGLVAEDEKRKAAAEERKRKNAQEVLDIALDSNDSSPIGASSDDDSNHEEEDNTSKWDAVFKGKRFIDEKVVRPM